MACVLKDVIAVSSLPDLLAEVGAGVTVIGGITGLVVGGASRSRRSLEDIALGAAVGGFLGCLASFLVYLLAKVAGG
jgi:hypothetical protein